MRKQSIEQHGDTTQRIAGQTADGVALNIQVLYTPDHPLSEELARARGSGQAVTINGIPFRRYATPSLQLTNLRSRKVQGVEYRYLEGPHQVRISVYCAASVEPPSLPEVLKAIESLQRASP
ncbi:MAG: hypothetical protein WD872_19420 [Pirellulaceae bacterium]